MRLRLSKPTPAFVVAVTALFVALGGTSYAVSQIGTGDIKDNSILSRDIANGTLRSIDIQDGKIFSRDIANGTLKRQDFAPGTLLKGDKGAKGDQGDRGAQGIQGPAGVGRWALVGANGEIIAQSGGFSVASAYPTLANTATGGAPDNSLRANGNIYINANEDLSDNGIVTTIALQNQTDQNGDTITNGRAGADLNFEFAGEISASMCGIPMVVACAPMGTNNTSHFVVSPRNSDGTPTDNNTRKRFYVIITGDSSDFVAPPVSPIS